MTATHFFPISLLTIAVLSLTVICSGFQSPPTVAGDIVLKDERLTTIPKEFYVAKVTDQRENRNAVAWLLPVNSKNSGVAKSFAVDLRGGCTVAIEDFIDHNLARDTSLRPVDMFIEKFSVRENLLADGRVEGHVQLSASFEMEQLYLDDLHLLDYNGNSRYTRRPGAAMDVEPLLRHLLENSLVYLNTWMNRQAGINIKLAKKVKVNFKDYHDTAKEEGDSIYYDVNRPLSWNDFQTQNFSSKYAAEVFPAFGYGEHTAVANGVVVIGIDLKVCMPKSACLVKPGSESDYALNHEQRHFDIEKIIAERFKRKVMAEDLPVNNFDGFINADYLESLTEMHNLQTKYDDETNHGANESKQQQWNEWIDNELRKFGVKK